MPDMENFDIENSNGDDLSNTSRAASGCRPKKKLKAKQQS